MWSFEELRMLQMDPSSGEEKFRALFEFANDCLVILNLQGEILDINQTGHERLGYAKDEMIGKPVSLFNAPEYTAISPRYIAELKNNGHATFELAHMRKDGSAYLELDGHYYECQYIEHCTDCPCHFMD